VFAQIYGRSQGSPLRNSMPFKSTYFLISIILLIVCSLKIGFSFNAIRVSPHSAYLGPAIVVFYLTYITDVFFYFYYLKNKHLNKKIRNVLISVLRLWITFMVFVLS